MIKKITIIFCTIIILLIIILTYLNFYGIETTRFNSLIKNEIKSHDSRLDIKLKKVKLLLDLKNYSIKVKTLNSTIIYNQKKIDIEKLSTIFSLKSYFNKNFVVKNLLISTKETSIKDLIYIGKSIKNSAQLLIFSQIIKKGTAKAIIDLRFDENGKIKSDYNINGITKNIQLNLPKNQNVNNISFDFNIKDKNFKFENISFNYKKIIFFSESILLKSIESDYFIEGNLKNNETLLNSDILSIFFNNNLNHLEINNTKIKSDSTFYLQLSKKYKIKDYGIKSKLNLNEIKYKLKSKLTKKYLENYKDIINIYNSTINIQYSKNNLIINGLSKYSINDFKNALDFKIEKVKDNYNFDINIDLNKTKIL